MIYISHFGLSSDGVIFCLLEIGYASTGYFMVNRDAVWR